MGSRLIRVVWIACLASGWAVGLPGQLSAQAPQLTDPVRQLNERLEKLERENAATREENARLQSFIRGRFPDFTQGPAPANGMPGVTQAGSSSPVQAPAGQCVVAGGAPTTITSDSGCPPEGFIERLGTHYDKGFVLMESSDPERIPFRLVFNNFAQVRYTNTQLDSLTFVDHLGGVRPVDPRNDISFNRDLFSFTGFVFDPKLKYNIIIWSSGSLASVVGPGGFTYEFSKEFALSGGYNALPGSRSLLGGYKDVAGIDRSMADSFFRPGFTQGVWASGEPIDNLYYSVMIGNSLNTLNIGNKKIDANLTYSGTFWWEPLGNYGPVQAYNDLEKHQSPVIRVGSCLTRSREDRFSDQSISAPDNIQIYNSDGVLFFSTGALAPGVTIDLANYTMWAIDGGFKYKGFSVNGQYFFRWLDGFRADGPLPISSTFDHGFEASVGHFFFTKTELYTRTSFVFGEFKDSHEFCAGVNWYPLENRGLRVVGEVGRVESSPVGNIITPYQAGMSGWMFLLQAQLTF
ncbi:MAG: hypothetical protein U0796_21250 [Gemmatales bacterium]